MFINNLETKVCHDSINHNETHIAKQLKYILIYKKKKKKLNYIPITTITRKQNFEKELHSVQYMYAPRMT